MTDQDINIRINTTATGSGVPQTAAGLKDVAGAAQKAAPAMGQLGTQSKATAAELGRGVEVGNAASTMVQNLAASTQGGASGFLSLARGAFGAGVALKGVLASMGPVGAIAAGIGIALGLITAALRKNEENAEAARQKLEALNKQKLDKAVEEQGKLKEAAEQALQKIEAEYTALERIADAELNKRKSAVDADKSLSPEEKERQKLALDRQREDEKRVALLGKEEAQARKLEDLSNESAGAAKKQADALASRKAALEELAAAQQALKNADATARLEEMATAASPLGGGSASAETVRAQRDAKDRLRRAEAGAKGVTPDQVDAESEAKVKAMQKEAEDAKKRATAAREAAELEAKTQRAENQRIAETRRNEDKSKIPETEAAKAKREAAQAKQDEQIRRTPAAIWNNKIATGGDVDMEALRRNFPDYKWAEVPEWKRKQQSTPMTPPSIEAAQPTTPPAPAQPGLGVVPAGTVLPAWQQSPSAALQLGGGRLPSDLTRTGLPGGITAGPSGSGSDNKDAKTAEALKGTTAAVKEQDTGKDTAKEAEALKKAAEEQSKAQQQAQAATKQALGAAKEVMSALTTTTNRHTSEIAMLRSQISALRSRA